MKKIIALAMALLLVLATMPAFADNERTNGLFTYELKKNGPAIITDYDWENNEGDVFVPGTIDGYTVVEIGEYAFACEILEHSHSKVSITLPESITAIGDFSFCNSEILSINIPNSVQTIGKGAFSGWKGYLYSDTENLQFRLSGDHPHFAVIDNALYNKDKKELLYFSNSYEIKVPNGITSIGDYALYRATIAKISLPSTLTHIGEYAFVYSGGYAGDDIRLTIPQSVTTIGAHAFEGVYSVDFGSTSITEIPDYAIKDVSHLKIDNPQNIEVLGIETGFGNIIESASQLSPKITTIPTGFGYNRKLKNLPSTVTGIDSMAFTEKVSDFKLSKNLTSIAEDAFPTGSTFIVKSGSYAERWASENGFAYTVEGQSNTDWLNN